MKNNEIILIKNIIPENIKTEICNNGKTVEEYFFIGKESIRNILINLSKYLINSCKKTDNIFTYIEIRENILVKEIDFLLYKFVLFNENYLKFEIKQYYRDWINMIIIKNNSLKYDIDKEDEFKTLYLKLKNLVIHGNFIKEEFEDCIEKCSILASEIHWKYLPIFDKNLIKKIGFLPEENVVLFYKNYYPIEELYNEITRNKIEFNKMNGDYNLNYPLDFKIYSSKENSYIKYTIFRTMYGWKINNIESLKDGKSIVKLLSDKDIFLPEEGIYFAFNKIWNLADDGLLTLDELKTKIQDIAIWISDVEKIIRNKKPKWCDVF